jgi:hypothetical protein
MGLKPNLTDEVLVLHKRYLGATWKICSIWTSGESWKDESGEDDSEIVPEFMPGSIIKAMGYLYVFPEILVWMVIKHVHPSGNDLRPFTYGEILGREPEGVVSHTPWGSTLTSSFCCEPYPEMLARVVDVPDPNKGKKFISHFPSTCPACRSPAYQGYSSFVCSRPGCDPTRKG